MHQVFSAKVVINDPIGIQETGSKQFLLSFPEICPPMRQCRSIEEVYEFSREFPLVIKPLRSYGGKGLMRLGSGQWWLGPKPCGSREFGEALKKLLDRDKSVLAMKFLDTISQGDKRVVVVNGEVLGAMLRKPADGSWIANLSSGGSSHYSFPDENEIEMARVISPVSGGERSGDLWS